MTPLRLPRVLLFLLLIPATTRSETTTAAPGANAAPANPAAASAALADLTTTVRASVGWRSNVTYSAFNPLDRGFYRAEADVFWLRPLGQHWELIALLSGDELRYFAPPQGVSGEESWIGHLEARWEPASWLRASLKTDGFLESTFIDPSQTEGSPQPPQHVRVHGGYATFAPRLTLGGGFVFEPSVQAKEVRYRGYPGDNKELRPGAHLEWSRSPLLVLGVTWYDHTRRYSELAVTKLSARPDNGWRLTLKQREAEAKVSTRFEAHGTWNLSLAAGRLENRDRAYGFLDYDQKHLVATAAWERAGWRVECTGDLRRLDYLHQEVGRAPDRAARTADVEELTGRIEHDLSATWTVFAEARSERNRSNAVDDLGAYPFSYRTRTALAGVQRTF